MDYIEKVSYKLDKDNRIIEVSDDWMKAAIVGKAEDLLHLESVIGKRLLSYVEGDATRMYYDVIFRKCRILNAPHTIEYRCDSPTHKRFMQMHIHPESNKNLDIENYLVKEEPFQNTIRIMEHPNYHLKEAVRRCSICNSLQLHPEEDWKDPGDLVKQGKKAYIVIHTVCPSCQEKDWRNEEQTK